MILLAKTCTNCGSFKQADDFGRWCAGKDGKQTNCLTCMRARGKEWRKRNPEKVKESQTYAAQGKRNREDHRRRNDASRARATRGRRHQWTSAELEVATRPDLTARQAADILGRTWSAVRQARVRVNRGEPKLLELLGAARAATLVAGDEVSPT